MHNHERLEIWHLSTALSVTMCRAIARTRIRRHRALFNQLERSITSVPSNIAEGSGQSTDPKFAHYIGIAIGSITESMSHLTQMEKLGLMPSEDLPAWREDLRRIRRMSEYFQRRLLSEPGDHYPSSRPKSRSPVHSPPSRSYTRVPRPES